MNYDIWILALILGLVFAIVVPAALRVRADRSRRVLCIDLALVAAREQAYYSRYHRYPDSLSAMFAPGTPLVHLHGDSVSWAAVISNDAISQGPRTCGVFWGAAAPPPIPAGTAPGRITCW